jgi:hypothetical protein
VLVATEVRTSTRAERAVMGPRDGWVPAGECWSAAPAEDSPRPDVWLREVVVPEVGELLVEGATVDDLERDGWRCEVASFASIDGVVCELWRLVYGLVDGQVREVAS